MSRSFTLIRQRTAVGKIVMSVIPIGEIAIVSGITHGWVITTKIDMARAVIMETYIRVTPATTASTTTDSMIDMIIDLARSMAAEVLIVGMIMIVMIIDPTVITALAKISTVSTATAITTVLPTGIMIVIVMISDMTSEIVETATVQDTWIGRRGIFAEIESIDLIDKIDRPVIPPGTKEVIVLTAILVQNDTRRADRGTQVAVVTAIPIGRLDIMTEGQLIAKIAAIGQTGVTGSIEVIDLIALDQDKDTAKISFWERLGSLPFFITTLL